MNYDLYTPESLEPLNDLVFCEIGLCNAELHIVRSQVRPCLTKVFPEQVDGVLLVSRGYHVSLNSGQIDIQLLQFFFFVFMISFPFAHGFYHFDTQKNYIQSLKSTFSHCHSVLVIPVFTGNNFSVIQYVPESQCFPQSAGNKL